MGEELDANGELGEMMKGQISNQQSIKRREEEEEE